MTTAQSAQRGARDLRNTTALKTLTRAGFVGYGVFHLAVAWLALQVAFGRRTSESDQSGAFQLLDRQPGGKVLLIVVTVGLAAMALWQLLVAITGTPEDRGVDRVVAVCRTIIYGVLAYTAAKVVAGAPQSSAKQQQKATAGILANSAGRWLVGLAGLIVVGVGIGLVVYGIRRSFKKRLRIYEMSPGTKRVVTGLATTGYIAKGVAFGIVGVLIFDAALIDNSARSRGLDGALHALIGQPFGQWLLALVAVGFAAFGVYCFWQARYRKI
jgi:Domain of Unknown Function (DUF1206)